MLVTYGSILSGFCSWFFLFGSSRYLWFVRKFFFGFVFLLYLDDAFAFETLLLWMGGIVCYMFEFGGMFCH